MISNKVENINVHLRIRPLLDHEKRNEVENKVENEIENRVINGVNNVNEIELGINNEIGNEIGVKNENEVENENMYKVHENTIEFKKPYHFDESFSNTMEKNKNEQIQNNEEVNHVKFTFDSIFDENSTQEEVYKKSVAPMIPDIMDGYNCTVFVYGNTGCLDPYTSVQYFENDKIQYKQAKDVKEGDQLVGDDFTVRNVLKLFQGTSDLYKVIQNFNDFYIVNDQHVLTLFDIDTNSVVDIHIKDYLQLSSFEKQRFRGLIHRRMQRCAISQLKTIPSKNSQSKNENKEEQKKHYFVHKQYTHIQVVPFSNGEYVGWMTDGNHRFLLEDGTVTHNSGKTYTMSGYNTHNIDKEEIQKFNNTIDEKDGINKKDGINEKDGIIPRVAFDIFKHIEENKETHSFEVDVSFIEIYMERIRDLLNPKLNNLKLREDEKSTYIENCTICTVKNYFALHNLIKKGEKYRVTATTKLNLHSSRSHSILILNVKSVDNITNIKKSSKLFLVDLAGSEHVDKSGAEGLTLKQAQHINKSLSTLSLVIHSLTTHANYIPYRNSKLTRLLTDSLGGNSKTSLILTCSASPNSLYETYSTLKFGQRTKLIKNKPTANTELSIQAYKKIIKELQSKIEDLTKEVDFWKCKKKGESNDLDNDRLDINEIKKDDFDEINKDEKLKLENMGLENAEILKINNILSEKKRSSIQSNKTKESKIQNQTPKKSKECIVNEGNEINNEENEVNQKNEINNEDETEKEELNIKEENSELNDKVKNVGLSNNEEEFLDRYIIFRTGNCIIFNNDDMFIFEKLSQ